VRLSSGLKVNCVSELGLQKHCYKGAAIATFMQLPLVFGEYNLLWSHRKSREQDGWVYTYMSVLSSFFNQLCTYVSYVDKVKRCLACCAVF